MEQTTATTATTSAKHWGCKERRPVLATSPLWSSRPTSTRDITLTGAAPHCRRPASSSGQCSAAHTHPSPQPRQPRLLGKTASASSTQPRAAGGTHCRQGLPGSQSRSVQQPRAGGAPPRTRQHAHTSQPSTHPRPLPQRLRPTGRPFKAAHIHTGRSADNQQQPPTTHGPGPSTAAAAASR